MKITLKNEEGTYTVKTAVEYRYINIYFNKLIIPVLLAAGFSPKTIKQAMQDEDYGL